MDSSSRLQRLVVIAAVTALITLGAVALYAGIAF
jgi:hypothetical protein